MLNYRRVGVFCERCEGTSASNLSTGDYAAALYRVHSGLNSSAPRTPKSVVTEASPVIQSIYKARRYYYTGILRVRQILPAYTAALQSKL